jgi:hypothetical protein
MLVIGELNLRTIAESRSSGTVLPLHDSSQTRAALGEVETVVL